MAKTRWATVLRTQELSGDVVRLDCQVTGTLGHVAGNYIIVRSTLPNPEKQGEVLRRAFSIASAPWTQEPGRFELVVQRAGATSEWLAQRAPQDRFEFSGPWGKRFRALPDDPRQPVHLVATGTGLSPTAALAWSYAGQGEPVSLWWQQAHPFQELKELREAGISISVHEQVCARVPVDPGALYFLAGDGAALGPLCERLLAGGVPPAQVRVEYFFNKPQGA